MFSRSSSGSRRFSHAPASHAQRRQTEHLHRADLECGSHESNCSIVTRKRVYAKVASAGYRCVSRFCAPCPPSPTTTRASPASTPSTTPSASPSPTPTTKSTGETTVDLRFLQTGVTQVVLDLASLKDGKGMTVTAVTSRGAALHFQHAADRLAITLDSAPAPGERRLLTVQYHGIAANGLHIAKNKFGDRTFFSWNWPTLARQWLPMIDHPSDKATSEFLVTAPSKYQVVANGLLHRGTRSRRRPPHDPLEAIRTHRVAG